MTTATELYKTMPTKREIRRMNLLHDRFQRGGEYKLLCNKIGKFVDLIHDSGCPPQYKDMYVMPECKMRGRHHHDRKFRIVIDRYRYLYYR